MTAGHLPRGLALVREKQRVFLKCEPLPPETERAAAMTVAGLAKDAADLRALLAVLGLA